MKKKKLNELIIPNAPLKFKDRNLGVMCLQIILDSLYPGKPSAVKNENGFFGHITETKLRKFQEAKKLHCDGRYTDLTRRVIREVLKECK